MHRAVVALLLWLVLGAAKPVCCHSAGGGLGDQPVTITTLEGALQPRLATTVAGSVFCTFGAGEDIFWNQLEPGENPRFTEPQRIASVPKLALGRRRGPRLAVIDNVMVVTAISHQTGQLLSWRSEDQGKQWSEQVTVNVPGDSAKEGLHAMAAHPDGTLACIWLDNRDKQMEVYGAISRDQGKTWQPDQRLYRSPDGSICECCHPNLVADPAGGWHVTWRNSLKGNRDMYYCHWNQDATVAEALPIGTGHWELNQCPMAGGDLAVSERSDQPISVWRRGAVIFYSPKLGQELMVSPGESPVLASCQEQVRLFFVNRRGGKLQMLDPENPESKPELVAEKVADPTVLSLKDQWLLTWESTQGKQASLMMKVIPVSTTPEQD